jgi:Sulfotransferase family
MGDRVTQQATADRRSGMGVRGSILVTGMPRSGTTWLARLLATADGVALTGREPMNPRGRQYALAGTLPGWTRLRTPTDAQRRALRRSHRGLTPLVYSRYGRRQWAAPLPWTRIVVKDPFAMLSMPAVVASTGATPVLVYRHPAAALASYRRMGWEPDLAELQPLARAHQAEGHPEPLRARDLPRPGEVPEPEAMGRFWAALYTMALSDADRTPGLLVVSHEEMAGGGEPAARALFEALGLRWSAATSAELTGREPTPSTAGPAVDAGPAGRPGADDLSDAAEATSRLHRALDRDPSSVARSWRSAVSAEELAAIEAVTEDVRGRLDEIRLRLTPR